MNSKKNKELLTVKPKFEKERSNAVTESNKMNKEQDTKPEIEREGRDLNFYKHFYFLLGGAFTMGLIILSLLMLELTLLLLK